MSKVLWVVIVAAILGGLVWVLVALNNLSYRSGYGTAEAIYLLKLDSVQEWHTTHPPSAKESLIYVPQPGGLIHDTVTVHDTVLFTPDSIWRPKFIWRLTYAYTTGLLNGVTVDGVPFSKEGVGSFAVQGDDHIIIDTKSIPATPKPPKSPWLHANLLLFTDAQARFSGKSAWDYVDGLQVQVSPGVVFWNTVRLGVGGGFTYGKTEGWKPAAFGSLVVRFAGKW